MQNLVENYRLALAKRKKARAFEARAHKHRKLECAYHDRLRALAAAERAETARIHAMREQAEMRAECALRETAAARKERAAAIAERNEFAGLVFCIDRNDYPAE